VLICVDFTVFRFDDLIRFELVIVRERTRERMSDDNDNIEEGSGGGRGANLIDDCWLQSLSFLGVRGLCSVELC